MKRVYIQSLRKFYGFYSGNLIAVKSEDTIPIPISKRELIDLVHLVQSYEDGY